MNIELKHLKPSDVDLLKQLIELFGDVFEDAKTYGDQLPTDEYLESLLKKDHFIALVAQNESQIIGGLAAYVLEKFEQDRREIYIYDLAVSKEFRRQKIATDLINQLKEVAKKKDAYIIFVQADKGDDPAIKLYESLGTKEEVFHFDISPNN